MLKVRRGSSMPPGFSCTNENLCPLFAYKIHDRAGFRMENLTVVLPTRAVTGDGIASGRVSASNRHFVEEMPRIPPEQKSKWFLARDMQRRRIYHLEYNRRMVGLHPKQTITGLRPFFQEHDLQPGDLFTLYKEEGNGLTLLGTLISPLYVIHFERVNEVADQ